MNSIFLKILRYFVMVFLGTHEEMSVFSAQMGKWEQIKVMILPKFNLAKQWILLELLKQKWLKGS